MNYKEKYTLDSKEAAVDNIVLTKKLSGSNLGSMNCITNPRRRD